LADQIVTRLPFRTTIFAGTIGVGLGWIKVIGTARVVVAFAFAALGGLQRWGWWRALTDGASAASVLLTTVGWPATHVGLLANAFIVAVGQRLNWL
jgi:hypothetical protein